MSSVPGTLEATLSFQRNVHTCAHCGESFARISEETPIINRSDGATFHVSLFSGPDRRHRMSGGVYRGQANCGFVYIHYQTRPTKHFVVVVIKQAAQQADEARAQIEQIADKLAGLLQAGKKLTAVYTSDDGQLTRGFPQ